MDLVFEDLRLDATHCNCLVIKLGLGHPGFFTSSQVFRGQGGHFNFMVVTPEGRTTLEVNCLAIENMLTIQK
ncbi:unnamed protein product [Cercopithifilaria johnstoni]|uniref:Uncharacterized protein n=1 Tax=Cercopithifilaria johnstoni TaxID=2874296 RepID=A0A8J2LZE0_9BILA|nr:unnamed protein product [Cercopithifilaria johnstoni]